MKKKSLRVLVVFSTAVLILSTMIVAVGAFETSEASDKNIVRVRISGQNDVSKLNRMDVEILQRYDNFLLIEADDSTIEDVESAGMGVNRLAKRTQVSVKGHTFDIEEEPDLDPELTIDGYEKGTEGLYVVHMLGPVHPEWRKTLEDREVNVVNYVPNYAYEVSMTPEQAEDVEQLDFVDWVGIYQPGFKLHSRLDEALDMGMSVNVKLKPGYERSSLMDIGSEFEVLGGEDLGEKGYRLRIHTDSMEELEDLALKNDVYFISPYVEPELHGEMDSQIIGGGCWFMDDYSDPADGDWREGDPNEPYRKHDDHGAYINQVGYTGEDVTITIADTGMGDGTEGNAGHPDLDGRVIGGYDFETDSEEEGSWADGNGHGTHCTGSAAGDTYDGTGETFGFADYYMAQGLAFDSELFSTRIFDDGGSFIPSEYYPIVEEPAQRSDTYVHSNSWGAGTEGAYSDTDEIYDQAVRDADRDAEDNQPMVITVSAGNDGERGDQTTGSPGNSKNVITLGATQTYNTDDDFTNAENMAEFSSRGWTEDNRVKPTVSAPGEGIYSLTPEGDYTQMSGTSMSNPAVAGASSVVVDWYEQTYGETPSPAMVKSILVNTAIDLDPEVGNTRGHIPNRDEGWGIVDISKLNHPTEDPTGFVFEDQETLLETGDVEEHIMAVEDENKPLNITLTWTDKNAQEGDSEGGTPTLKNNLDLEVESPSGEVIRGNAFDLSGDGSSDDGYTYPDADVMADFDYEDDGWDDVNNVENVFIPSEDVEVGAYTVRVIGTNVPEDANNDGSPNQDYALSAHNAAEGAMIEIERPRGGEYREYWETGTDKEIRWNTTEGIGNITEVDLEYSVDGGASWSYIVQGIDDTGSYLWQVPDEPSDRAKIRGTVYDDHPDTAPGTHESEEFTITNITPPEVTVVSPNGGEEWHAGDEEDILWDIDEGDEPIESVDIEYSVDGGSSWTMLEEDTEDTGSYTWRIPDETTSEALVQIWVYCEGGTVHYDRSDDYFDLVGIPPEPPGELEVEHDNGDNLVTWTKSPGDWSDGMMVSQDSVEEEQQQDISERSEPNDGIKVDGLDQNKVDKSDESAPKSLQGTERPESSGSELKGEELLQDEYYAHDAIAGDTGEHIRFPPDAPGSYETIGPNEASNFIAGATWVVDTWYGAEFDGDLWTIDENDGSMENIGSTPGFNGLAYDSSTDTLYGDDGDALYTVDPDTGESETVGSYDISYTMIGIASDNQGNLYGITVDDSETADLYSIDPDTGEATSIGDTGLQLMYAQDLAYDKTTGELYLAAYFDDGTDPGLYRLNTDTAEPTHIGDFGTAGEVEIAGFAIPYVVEGPFFSVNIEDYNEEPSPGEDVVVNYTVTNLGNETDTQDINFTVNGMVKESVEITLAEEEQHNDQFVWDTTNKVGSYYLGVESNETEDIVMVMLGDTKKVSHYNIYQAEDQNGPWDEPIAQVDADGSSSYEFVDTGAAGEPYDWYVVRAVSEDDAEEPNNYAVREPAGPEVTTVSPEDDVIITEDDVTVEWEGSEDIGNYEIQLNDGDLIDVGTDTEYTFENIPEGTHQVFVFGHNETSGEVGYDSVRFKVDRSPPALEIKYPEDGEYINEVSIMAEWQGYDDVSGIQHYSVRVNDGNWTNVEWDTTWELDDLEHGETYTVEVQVTDWAGWDTIESTTFTVDIVDPSIDIEFPVDGEWGSINTTAQWEGFDEVSGVDYYEVRLDGEEWVEVGTETEYEFIDLEVEEHTIEVRANDRAGNDNVTSTTFDIDPENPQLKVVSPGSDTVFDTDKVSVAWSGHDQHSGLSHIEVRLNDGEWIDVGISSSYTFTGLEDGTHTATVKAIDNVYHESYDEVSFTVDTVPPQLSISSPEQGAIYDDGEVTVEWQGSSETTDMDHYEVRLDNGAWEDVGLDESYTFGDLDDGNHLVYVRAIDGAGHTTTETVSFTVDSVAPELEVLAPEDGELFAENEVTVTWDSSDDGSGISHHEVRLDEGEWRDVGTSSLYTFKTLEEGEHVVEVRVTDEAGHTNEGEVSFTVDTSSPELEITSPEPKALFAESEVDVTWDGGDDISGIENYKVRLDQGEWIDAGTDTQYSFDELSDGDHVVELIAEDGAGHTSTETITFSVDTTSPRLYILSPEHEKTIDKDEVTVRFSGNDETSEVAYYEVRVNGGEWIDIGSNTQHTFEGLSEGDNTIEIKAVDDAGNERTTELTVTVDESISIYWWIIIAIVILAVLLVVVMVMVARGGEEEEEEPKAPGMAAAPPAQGTETQETGWDEELYEEPSEEGFEEQEEVPPSQSEEPPTDEEIFEEEEQDDQEVPPPPPPESEGSTEEDLLEDLEEEEETE